MSLLERLDVPLAQSLASTIAVVSPRVTASSALPAPTTPPPKTSPSTAPTAMRSIASSRADGDKFPADMSSVTRSVDLHPVECALYCLLPACITFLALLFIPLRVPALGFVPVDLELAGVRPEAGGKPCRVPGAEG